jgi:hypothetical protein
MKLFREPLVHFLFIGAFIYLGYGWFAEPTPQMADDTLIVSAGEIEWMRQSWQKRWNRPPTTEELDGLIQQYIRETVLYREALAMGLDQDDAIIRRRLAQKLEFLARDLAMLASPTGADLRTYFNQHRERYQEPVLYTFTQVYFDPDRRGDMTLADVEAVKAALIDRPEDVDGVGALGDPFMLQSYYPEHPQIEIQKLFGSGFAESVVGLSPGQWHGPVLSGYGTHLVYVHGVTQPPEPVFEQVRTLVQQDWESDRRESMDEAFYASLRERYDIVIELPEPEDRVAELQEPVQ